MTAHKGFVPFLTRLWLGVSLGDLKGMVALVPVSLVWPTLPKEMVDFIGEISEDGFSSVCSKMIISCCQLLLHLFI